MIIKYNDKTDKWLVWNGYAHQPLSEEFDTLEQAQQELKRLSEEEEK